MTVAAARRVRRRFPRRSPSRIVPCPDPHDPKKKPSEAMKKKLSITQILAVLVLPVLVGLAVFGAVSPMRAQAESVSAALVNLDEPATLPDGSTMPAGRLLAGRLLEPDTALTAASSTGATEDTLDFTVVGQSDADAGLAEGAYDAVVVIPQGFSDAVASTLGGTPADATVQVRTNDASSRTVGALTQQVVGAASQSLGTTITVGYLDSSLTSMTTLGSSLSEAADGASAIADGAGTAQSGASALADGATTASTGADELSDGLSALASGAERLSGGAQSLSGGVSQLSSGASTLSSGASTVASGTRQLADGTSLAARGAAALSTGVSDYAGGVRQVYDSMTTPQTGASQSLVDGAATAASGAASLAAGVDEVVGGLEQVRGEDGVNSQNLNQTVSAYVTTVQEVAGSCDMQEATCQQLKGALAALSAQGVTSKTVVGGVEWYTGGVDTLHAGVTAPDPATGLTLAGGAAKLADGSRAVAGGVAAVAGGIDANLLGENADALTSGATALARNLSEGAGSAAQLAAGASQVSSGAASLASGAAQAVDGASDLADGAGVLSANAQTAAQGASALSTGIARLEDGAHELASGMLPLASGSGDLADQLQSGADQVPSFTDARADALADALAQPVGVDAQTLGDVSVRASIAPAAASVALWIAGLAVVLLLGVMSARTVEAAMSPVRVLGTSLRPALVLALVQALLVAVVLAIWGGGLGSPAGTVGLLVLGAVTMTVVHSALVAALGTKMGAAASVLLLVVQVASLDALFPGAGQNGFFGAVRAVLPLPALEAALQNRLVGPIGSGAGGSVAILVAWLAVSAVVAVAGVMRRRSTTVAEIRSAIAHA
jgi:putative membrane protein